MHFVHYPKSPHEAFVRMDVVHAVTCITPETATPNTVTVHNQDPGIVWIYEWRTRYDGTPLLVKNIYPRELWDAAVKFEHRHPKHPLQPPS